MSERPLPSPEFVQDFVAQSLLSLDLIRQLPRFRYFRAEIDSVATALRQMAAMAAPPAPPEAPHV